MATSTIKKIIPSVTANPISFSINSTLFSTQNWASWKFGNVVQYRFSVATLSTISAGTVVTVGTLSGDLPILTTYTLCLRESGELQGGQVMLPTTQNGNILLNALTSIPSGVVLIITGSYICS